MKDKKHCERCGNDLYCESNILLESKALTDKLLNEMNTECVGRPLFALIIGSDGSEWCTSEFATFITQEDEISAFYELLEELIRMSKEKK